MISFHARIQELRNNPETSRAGSIWLNDEDDQLFEEINNKISIEDIAKIHKRSIGSIKTRLMLHIMSLDEDASIEETCARMNIDIDEFNKFKEKQDAKNNTNKEIKEIKKQIKKNDDKYMNILTEIRDLLIVISKK